MGEASKVSTTAMNPRVGLQKYLVTYSQGDECMFSIWENVRKMLETKFNGGAIVVKVNYRYHRGAPEWWLSISLSIEADRLQKWLWVKNGTAEKHGIQVNISDKHNFYLSATWYVGKSDQVVVHSKNHPTGLLEVHKSRIFMCCCKEAKNFDQPGFSRLHSRKGYQKLHWAPCYCWGMGNCRPDGNCIQTKWKKIYSVNLLPKLDKWSQPKKNWSQPAKHLDKWSQPAKHLESIHLTSGKCWRLFWSVVTVCQGRVSAQWNWNLPVCNQY